VNRELRSSPLPEVTTGPDMVSDKSGAVKNQADRMFLIDTNADVGTNGWDVLRFVLRFFCLNLNFTPSGIFQIPNSSKWSFFNPVGQARI